MQHACGYVACSLLKIKGGDIYSQYVQCLGDMAVEGEGDNILTQGSGSIKLIDVAYSLLMITHFPSLLKQKNVYVQFYHSTWCVVRQTKVPSRNLCLM